MHPEYRERAPRDDMHGQAFPANEEMPGRSWTWKA